MYALAGELIAPPPLAKESSPAARTPKRLQADSGGYERSQPGNRYFREMRLRTREFRQCGSKRKDAGNITDPDKNKETFPNLA